MVMILVRHPMVLYFSTYSLCEVCSHVDYFDTRNKILTAKFLKQGYSYYKLQKAYSKFYRRQIHFMSKHIVGLKTLLLQGLSKSEFDGDLASSCGIFSTLVLSPK